MGFGIRWYAESTCCGRVAGTEDHQKGKARKEAGLVQLGLKYCKSHELEESKGQVPEHYYIVDGRIVLCSLSRASYLVQSN